VLDVPVKYVLGVVCGVGLLDCGLSPETSFDEADLLVLGCFLLDHEPNIGLVV
jgi:hypothetical protein